MLSITLMPVKLNKQNSFIFFILKIEILSLIDKNLQPKKNLV
jgi:hypothetical protein